MGSVMEALEEGCHVDEGRHYWKKCKHECNGRRNGVQLSVLVGVDHSAIEGERKKGSRLRESSIAVLVLVLNTALLRALIGAPLRPTHEI